MSVDLQAIRNRINPPSHIESLEHLSQLIHDPDCFSVVEEKFYDDLIPIFADLKGREVPGDITVTGVWKGGSSLYLQALNRHFELGKSLWLSDTFAGFLEDGIRHEKDRLALKMFSEELKFTAQFPTPEDVRRLFESVDLWGDEVTIFEGPLEQTIARRPWQSLALVHIDVDFYEPTTAALELTYDDLNPGGYVVVDDYGVEIFNCGDAVDEFRVRRGISDPIHMITDYIAYWQKT